MKITLLGFTVPDETTQQMMVLDKVLATQTHKFAWALARSLRLAGGDVELISSVQISSYPAMPWVYVKGEPFSQDGFSGHTLTFLNLVVLKHITRLLSCFLTGRKMLRKHRTQFLLVHGVHSAYLVFALFMRSKGIKVIVVVTDPPGVVVDSDSMVSTFLKRLDAAAIRFMLHRCDGLIGLTPAILSEFGGKTSSILLPGFYKAQAVVAPIVREEGEAFIVAYAGGLSASFGVDRLIEAVLSVKRIVGSKEIRLVVFGRGELEGYVASVSDGVRIDYRGALSPAELEKELIKVDLLINPRPSDQSFVRYSFPSKILDYMSSGVAVLTTVLPGISDDYMEHMFPISDETSDGIRRAIEGCAAMPVDAIRSKGRRAREFVSRVASEASRGEELRVFLNNLAEENENV